MDKNVDSPFDFDLHIGQRPGLFIELAPGDFEPNGQRWVSVDERVFGFVEIFLTTRISHLSTYSHYGVNNVKSADWGEALGELCKYSENISLQTDYNDRRWIESGYAEIDEEFCQRFERTRIGVGKMAAQLIDWTDSWSSYFPNIFIHGI